jgi:hypothetical protein
MDIDKITNLISGKPIRLGRGTNNNFTKHRFGGSGALIGFYIAKFIRKTSSKLISKFP